MGENQNLLNLHMGDLIYIILLIQTHTHTHGKLSLVPLIDGETVVKSY